jgi:hypothetical protein
MKLSLYTIPTYDYRPESAIIMGADLNGEGYICWEESTVLPPVLIRSPITRVRLGPWSSVGKWSFVPDYQRGLGTC